MHEAMFYEIKDEIIRCQLCPHYCEIKEGHVGICGVRKHINQKLYALSYGRITSASLDPIEKKPLFHFYPGTHIFSVGSYGCNMHCGFCQNYQISQNKLEVDEISVDTLLKHVQGIGLAFTYNEPTIMYEYIYDAARVLKAHGYQVVLVTNGLINKEPLEKLLAYIDAFNVDLKSFDSAYYKQLGGHLQTVKNSIKIMSKKHVEVTSLMVRDEVTLDMIDDMARFIASIDINIPYHISRYFPNYQYTKDATDLHQLELALQRAKKHLNYVYIGNTLKDNHTYCHKCGKLLIRRLAYRVEVLEDCGCKHEIVGFE